MAAAAFRRTPRRSDAPATAPSPRPRPRLPPSATDATRPLPAACSLPRSSRRLQHFIAEPGENDVPVSAVFTDEMFAELKASMAAVGWTGLEEVRARRSNSESQSDSRVIPHDGR